ncbi:MAG TPA: ZIP family metal transporter [Candidatus Acidoferrales bacterium]|nr:ZIP family metal transporter [Candidatus Acidoferrales bacterium]
MESSVLHRFRVMVSPLALATVAALADVVGSLVVTRAHRGGQAPLRYFVAGGAGFMLAAAFVRMLPESTHVPHAFLFVLIGYFGVHLFEHTVAPHFHFGEEVHAAALLRPATGVLAVLGLGVHTLFDGVAIAAGFMVSPTLGLLLFFAVLLHKVPEGFAVASIVLATGHSRQAALLAGATLGFMTLVGAVGTTLFAGRYVGYALALSAGVTIYVAASDLIPEVNREGGPALAWTVFGGLLLFACADWVLSSFGLE